MSSAVVGPWLQALRPFCAPVDQAQVSVVIGSACDSSGEENGDEDGMHSSGGNEKPMSMMGSTGTAQIGKAETAR